MEVLVAAPDLTYQRLLKTGDWIGRPDGKPPWGGVATNTTRFLSLGQSHLLMVSRHSFTWCGLLGVGLVMDTVFLELIN